MAALLCDLQPGDEVIMPSYTFSSTANAFVLRGAVPVFVDIRADTLNIDETLIEQAITPRTKVICAVHYAGLACEMDTICDIAKKHNLLVVEDAAQGKVLFHSESGYRRVVAASHCSKNSSFRCLNTVTFFVHCSVSVDIQGSTMRIHRRLRVLFLSLHEECHLRRGRRAVS